MFDCRLLCADERGALDSVGWMRSSERMGERAETGLRGRVKYCCSAVRSVV